MDVSVSLGKHKNYYSYRCRNVRQDLCKCNRMRNARIVENAFFAQYFDGSPENQFIHEDKETKERIEILESKLERFR